MIEKIMELLKQTSASTLNKKEILDYIIGLEDDRLMLLALRANGVDNWIWYDTAIDTYYRWKEEEDMNEGNLI